MMKIPIKKWGNSHAIRLPKSLLDVLHAENEDELIVEIEKDSIILKKSEEDSEELTIEKLFEGYNGESFESEIEELRSVGDEQW